MTSIELSFQIIFLADDNESDAHSEESDWIRF